MDNQAITDIVQQLPDGVVVIDVEGNLKWANATAERMLGVCLAEAVGRSTLDFVHPEDVELVALALGSIQGKDVGTPIELRVRATDGWRLVELVGTNRLADPAVRGLVLCLRDLTERRRWEVAWDEVSRFRALVHHAATIMMLLDEQGRVVSVSAAIMRLLGHDQEEVEGHLLADLVDEPDRALVAEALQHSVAAAPSTGPCTVEVRMLGRAGTRAVPFELHIVNLLDDPTVRGFVVSGHDVTQLRQSLDKLADAQAELLRQERLAAIGQMASMIGHELRNPLTAVTNAHFLVRQGLGEQITPDAIKQLAMAEREVGRAVRLAEDLMSYVRPRTAERVPVALGELVEQVLEATTTPANVAVEVEVEPLVLHADAGQLIEVVANLVTNACQSMPDGGMLRIAARAEHGDAVITVEDEGPGVDPVLAESLFEPFFSTKSEGIGLGLAIVRRLVEAHGGAISLVNRPRGGAAAIVRLPLEAVSV